MKTMSIQTLAVPDPHPTAKIPASPPLSENSLGPPTAGPASEPVDYSQLNLFYAPIALYMPISAIDLGFTRGRVPFLFFSNMVDAAPILRTILFVVHLLEDFIEP